MTEKIRARGKWISILVALLMCVFLGLGVLCIIQSIKEVKESKDRVAEQWFEPCEEYKEKQYLEFQFIAGPVAEIEMDSKLGLYLVFDKELRSYMVCLEQARVEEEFAAIYEYTLSDSDEVLDLGYVEGYAHPIEPELKEHAAKEYNRLWKEEFVNEANFEEYLGNQYLDTTGKTQLEEHPASLFITGSFFICIFVAWVITLIRGRHKSLGEKSYSKLFVTVVISILCAGTLFWILFFKDMVLGIIFALIGVAVVFTKKRKEENKVENE